MRATSTAQLLRHLGIAFSTYRLYPGDLSQPALVAAAERLEETARDALAGGAVEVAVRSGRFYVHDDPVADDRADRLADACFQRRVEHLRVHGVPTLADLDAFFDALTRSPAAVEAAGGVHALLAAGAVTALAAREGAPDPESGRPDDHATRTVRERHMQEAPPADVEADADAALPPLAAVPGETAQGLYERLRAVSDSLADEVSARSSFFRRAAQLADRLPDDERTAFGALVLEHAAGETFAERYVGHLTDVDLASGVADVARSRGADAVSFAAETAAVTGRHDALVRLVEAALAQTAAVRPEAGPRDGDPPEGRRLRDAFPADADSGRALALTALGDYLRARPDPQQAERVATAAAGRLRHDVEERATERIRTLLAALSDAEQETTPQLRPLLSAPRRDALSPAVLADLAEAMLPEQAAAGAEVLEPFGDAAVGALLDALAAESRRTVRGLLVGLLTAVVGDDPGRLEPYLGDARWFVARNIATTLRRVRHADAVPLLERLARHPHQAVRQEALHGLGALPEDQAAPVLARLAASQAEREDRVACLEALAGFGTPSARQRLAELASRRTRPRLPWALRRHARRLAGEAGGR